VADVSVTAASVVKTASTAIRAGIAGATITAGQPIYLDSTASNKAKPADADALATAAVVGIALNSASDGQPIDYATAGNVTYNSAFTVGQVYVASTNAGGIAPYADLGSGDYVTILGVATTATNLKLSINQSGIAKP
jgi:hypothetical protein